MQEYGIRGFPTIKVFVPGNPPVDYQGARDVKPIAEYALKQVCSVEKYLNLSPLCFGLTMSFLYR
jgi:protein disulfide-isomerase A6